MHASFDFHLAFEPDHRAKRHAWRCPNRPRPALPVILAPLVDELHAHRAFGTHAQREGRRRCPDRRWPTRCRSRQRRRRRPDAASNPKTNFHEVADRGTRRDQSASLDGWRAYC